MITARISVQALMKFGRIVHIFFERPVTIYRRTHDHIQRANRKPCWTVARIAATAKSATAATDESIKEGLRQAICFQDWDSAIELSSNLISSSGITPEHRQTLVDWRHRFMDYARDKNSFDKIPNCERVQPRSVDIKVQAYGGPAPRFSRTNTLADAPVCYMERSDGQIVNLSYMCGSNATPTVEVAALPSSQSSNLSDLFTFGVRAEGRTVIGNIWNSGLTPANNVKITIRAQQTGRSKEKREVVIDRIGVRGEADFVASFNHIPENWSIS